MCLYCRYNGVLGLAGLSSHIEYQDFMSSFFSALDLSQSYCSEVLEPLLRQALARAYELKPLLEGVPAQASRQESEEFLVRAYDYIADHHNFCIAGASGTASGGESGGLGFLRCL